MSKGKLFLSTFVVLSWALSGATCLAQQLANPELEARIFLGGDILTMRGTTPEYVESLVVKDGKILYAGTLAESARLAGTNSKRIDLKGKTLLPGFIDTHGHFVYFGKNLVDATLFACADIAELVSRMKKQAERTPEGAWIVGFGYQARTLREGRAPTHEELDQISANRPVMIVDSSGHLGAANGQAFQAAGITADSPNPTGGSFERKTDGKSLLGPMEETALNAVRSKRPALTGAAEVWASYGQTTAMEAGLGLGNDDIGIVLNAIDKKLLPIDLYIAAKDSSLDDTLAAAYSVASQYNPNSDGIVEQLRTARPDLDRRYVNRVRMGGVKFWLDGSLDTAWFTQPYSQNPPGKTGAFSGYQQIPDEVLDAVFDKYWTSDLQIHMHMNGDAAADQALSAIAKAVKKYGMRDHRPVFVHAALVRVDQIEKIKTYGAIPSFLTAGIATAGDAVVRLWGQERAAIALASRTFLRNGLPFTFSHDSPVTPVPSILALVDAGVNRISASGQVVGPEETIPPYHALRAVTAMAAYQLKEESSKGTLEAGKLADLVILDKNPLKVESTTIKDIVVLETIKEGKTVFTRSSSN